MRPTPRGAVGLAGATGLLLGLLPAVLDADPVEVVLALGVGAATCLAGYPDAGGELVSSLMGSWVGVALPAPAPDAPGPASAPGYGCGAPAVDHDPRGGTEVRTWLTHGTRDRGLSWKHLGRSEAHPQPADLRRTD